MKIEYAYFRGYKRLSGSRIYEFEGEFKAPVQIIVGSNSSGKTSLMRELSPLPSIRTDYEKDGVKELRIVHDQHHYILKSDFTNRTNPHSFIMDDVELNVGHTSQIQEELAIKHFGFTPAVRDLVYGKTKICSMTPVNRKNMFLQLNPMDLTLVIDTFRKALGIYKDSKANVTLLNTRKANLEASMLPTSQLEEYRADKLKLEQTSSEYDQRIYGLKQYIATLKDTYREALDFYANFISGGNDPLPLAKAQAECQDILKDFTRFRRINRNTYQEDQIKCGALLEQLKRSRKELITEIQTLKQEVNEYEQHLSEIKECPKQKLEAEIVSLQAALKTYDKLIDNPIPESEITTYQRALAEVEVQAEVFSSLSVKMIEPEKIYRLSKDVDTAKYEVSLWKNKVSELSQQYEDLTKEITTNVAKASVPSSCTSEVCGLKQLFNNRYEATQRKAQHIKEQLGHAEVKYKEAVTSYHTLSETLAPYLKIDAVTRYRKLEQIFTLPCLKMEDSLIDLINRDPRLLIKKLVYLISESQVRIKYDKLNAQLLKLQTELAIVKKSNSELSVSFLQKQLKTRSAQYQMKLELCRKLDIEIAHEDSNYQTYAAYVVMRNKLQKLQELCSAREQAYLAHAAVEFWSQIVEEWEQEKCKLQEKLRIIDATLRDQEVIQRTYESETIALLNEVTVRQDLYNKLATALSPNTGLVHKSMVKYLNAMIDNVNYFIEQLWSFNLKLQHLNPERELNYQFPIDIDFEHAQDINKLSDGQTEIVDFTWSLAILLQLKMLHQIPLYADELGRACDITHRNKILLFLNSLVDSALVEQIFLINHYAALQEGFVNADIICLNHENLGELPAQVNEHIRLVKI